MSRFLIDNVSRHRVLYLLGYIPKDNRLYLGDKELNVVRALCELAARQRVPVSNRFLSCFVFKVSYSLLLSVLEYQTAVMRKDFETADKVLPSIPKDQRTRVAHFLEKQVDCGDL